ncbi:MAG: NAD-binding protein, partial [Paracoccaceae bacterium]|nr:NAD-binding protein [Paracoccaceae bacterium]
TVGAGINFGTLFNEPGTVLGLTLGLMALKGAVLYVLCIPFNMHKRDRWLFTLGLAQAGEFGFVLISFSTQQNVLPTPLAETMLLVVALSMLLTPLFFMLYDYLSRRIGDNPIDQVPDEIDEQHPIIIAGIGRFGQVVNRLIQSSGFNTTVLDHDLKTIQLMRAFGFKSFFGDPSRPEVLHAAGLPEARVLVVTLDDPKAAVKVVKYARSVRPDLYIVARAHDRMNVFELHRAGADKIVREMFDSSLRTGRYVLEHLGLTDFEAHEVEQTFSHMDRSSLRELAEVWDPKVPITKNTAYIELAKARDKELELALLGRYSRKKSEKKNDA